MLLRLSIENYILIEKLDLIFGDSLNIITGETGAGKSILLGALSLLTGSRNDSDILRNKSKNCVLEAEFNISKLDITPLLLEIGLESDENLIIRRVFTPSGKSRTFVNDMPIQNSTVKELTSKLLDIHSQNANILIADNDFRFSLLDSRSGNEDFIQYTDLFDRIAEKKHELVREQQLAAELNRDKDWLEFNLDQLEKANPSEEDYLQLLTDQKELANAGDIRENISLCLEELENEDFGILSRLKRISKSLDRIAESYPPAMDINLRINGIREELKDIDYNLSSENDRIADDPGRLSLTDARLDTYFSLMQKHGASSVGDLLKIWEEYSDRLLSLESNSDRIEQLNKEIGSLEKNAWVIAEKLHSFRYEAAKKISSEVVKGLTELGINSAVFTVVLTKRDSLNKYGADDLEFLFSSDSKRDPGRLDKTASGGELSRIMLILKSIAARQSELPSVIFDEIDTGVSGKIADAMGNMIHELSTSLQTIDITHLPQIASKGSDHFLVYKETRDGKSETFIRKLNGEERITEIAKMLSGDKLTPAAIEQAKYLLEL